MLVFILYLRYKVHLIAIMINKGYIERIIKEESKNVSEIFSKIFQNGSLEYFDFIIDEKKLDNQYLNEVNITLQGDFASMFQKLQEFDEYPALYFFEINPLIKKEEIISLIQNIHTEYGLSIPAKNKTSDNSGVLYVGKVKRCAWGRLIQHLGYHRQRKSHGLQIDYWANKTSLDLRLSYTVIFFDKSMINYIQALEQTLSKSLKPIIGKY